MDRSLYQSKAVISSRPYYLISGQTQARIHKMNSKLTSTDLNTEVQLENISPVILHNVLFLYIRKVSLRVKDFHPFKEKLGSSSQKLGFSDVDILSLYHICMSLVSIELTYVCGDVHVCVCMYSYTRSAKTIILISGTMVVPNYSTSIPV